MGVTIKETASPLNNFNVLLADTVSQYSFRVTFSQHSDITTTTTIIKTFAKRDTNIRLRSIAMG